MMAGHLGQTRPMGNGAEASAGAARPAGRDPAIRTMGLTKRYSGERGLFNLDVEVASGEIFGYLGPNGAGKTTTIRLLMGLIHPSAGTARVFGLDCQSQAVEVKRSVGYVPSELPDFGTLRGREVVAYLGAMAGRVEPQRVKELSDRLQFDLARPYREYSRGNRQKLALLLAFLHRPRLLILDEPSGGLDPLNQREFCAMVLEARRNGATVFLSSHVLSEVERVCDRVGIIRAGRLIEVASLEELHAIRSHRVEIAFAGPIPLDAIRAADGVIDVKADDGRVHCLVQGSFEPLMRALAGAHIEALSSHEPSLEESFLQHYAAAGAEQGRA